MSLSQSEFIAGVASQSVIAEKTSSSVLRVTGSDSFSTAARTAAEQRQIPDYLFDIFASYDGNSVYTWLKEQAISMKLLFRTIPHYKCVLVTYCSGMSFFRQAAPCILLGRFFGKEVVLSYQSNKAEAEMEDYGRGIQPFIRLCDRVEVSCRYLAGVFAGYGIEASVAAPIVNRELFAPRMISSVQPRIVVARRHERGNNMTCAIKAFRRVKQKFPRAELIILGDGPQREGLEWLVESERILGVTFTGQVSQTEVARQYSLADIYLNCSTLDGLPLSLLEALSVGIPVISTSVGEIPVVIQDRVNGLLVDNADQITLADHIIELVENPSLAESLSANSQQTDYCPV